jgi:hypothetical protein
MQVGQKLTVLVMPFLYLKCELSAFLFYRLIVRLIPASRRGKLRPWKFGKGAQIEAMDEPGTNIDEIESKKSSDDGCSRPRRERLHLVSGAHIPHIFKAQEWTWSL